MKASTREALNTTFQTILLTVGLFFLARVLRNNVYYVAIAPLEEADPVLYEGLRYLGHFSILVFIAIYFALDKAERSCFKSAAYHKNSLPLAALGLLIGFLMNGGSILTAILHGDMDMVFQNFNPLGLLFIFLCVAIQSSTEEIHFRLWGHSRILRKASLSYAAIGSALAFSLIHMLNTGITFIAFLNIFLIGVLYSLSVYYFDSIWFCCAHHTAWNFTQNCVFGLPNSGVPAVITIAAPTYTEQSFFYDPVFGIEGTAFTSLMIAAVIVIFLILIKRRKRSLK